MDTLKTQNIDIEKVKQLFDELLTFELDNRHTQEYVKTRVQIADEVFKLAMEIIELMYRLNLDFLGEVSKEEAIERINEYRMAQQYLDAIMKDVDILQV